MTPFRIGHTIAASVDAIQSVLVDRDTLLAVSATSPIGYRAEMVRHSDTGAQVERVARFSASGLRALTGVPLVPDRVEWMDQWRWTRATHHASFVVDPFLTTWLRPRVGGAGDYRLLPSGTGSTRRVVEGQVRVDIPVLGVLIERTIIRLVERHFEAEARFLRERAATTGWAESSSG